MTERSALLALVFMAIFVVLLLHRRIKHPKPLLPMTAGRSARTVSRLQRVPATTEAAHTHEFGDSDASAVTLLLPPGVPKEQTGGTAEERANAALSQGRDVRIEPGLHRVKSELLVSPPALKPIRTVC